jgi:hypothetical protein
MATFSRRLSDGRWHIRISGRLRAVDLRRLERTCAPALERYPTPLTLQLDRLAGLDEPARLFVQRLLDRGATLTGSTAETWVVKWLV